MTDPTDTHDSLTIDDKPWWQSKTILAACVAMLPPLAKLLGLDMGDITPYTADLITIIGAVFAIIGRRAATVPIKKRTPRNGL